MSFYAPDKEHNWIVLHPKAQEKWPQLARISGRDFFIKNYAGICWGYEIEVVPEEERKEQSNG